MSGTIQQIFRKTTFDVSVMAAGSMETIFANFVDASTYEEASLLVRVHSNNIVAGGGSFDVVVRADSRSPADPGMDFQYLTVDLATLNINTATTAPALLMAPIKLTATDLNNGGSLRVIVRGNGGGAAVIKATISVDLSLKS